jgi:integrase
MDTVPFGPNCQPPQGEPWTKGKLGGSKPPLLPKHVWAIRTRLHMLRRKRDLALFNLAIDSKLRGCDLIRLRILDVAPRGYAVDRASIRQRKTCQPVKFELTEQTKLAIDAHLAALPSIGDRFLFPGKAVGSHLSTRQYARLLNNWLALIGLDPSIFGTHSLRRTKPTLIYRKTGNLRAVQLLLGHTKIESTVRYLGIEVDDALEIAEKVDV